MYLRERQSILCPVLTAPTPRTGAPPVLTAPTLGTGAPPVQVLTAPTLGTGAPPVQVLTAPTLGTGAPPVQVLTAPTLGTGAPPVLTAPTLGTGALPVLNLNLVDVAGLQHSSLLMNLQHQDHWNKLNLPATSCHMTKFKPGHMTGHVNRLRHMTRPGHVTTPTLGHMTTPSQDHMTCLTLPCCHMTNLRLFLKGLLHCQHLQLMPTNTPNIRQLVIRRFKVTYTRMDLWVVLK